MYMKRQLKQHLLVFSSAALVLVAGVESGRTESRDFPQAKKVRPAGNDGGFFNFLDFSRRTTRRRDYQDGNFFGDEPRRRRVRRPATNSFAVKHYTYKPDRYSVIRAAGLQLPLPDARSGTGDVPGRQSDDAASRSAKLDNSLAQMIFESLKAGLADVRVTAAQRKAIVDAYRGRVFEPLWTSMDGLEDGGRGLIGLFARAEAEGFDREDYRVPVLSEQGSVDEVESNLAAIARLDIELTALAVRYASDASGGAVVPNRLSGYHDLKPPRLAAATALKRLSAAVDPAAYLASLQPRHPAYVSLREALAEANSTIVDVDEFEPLPAGPTLRPGMTDDRVGLVRARLITLGHLDAGEPQGQDANIEPAAQELPVSETVGDSLPAAEDDTFYDRDMIKAVRSFQRESGLRPDALIGPATLRALNGHKQDSFDRMARIKLNMERLRWLPRSLGQRHIFVNQASYRLKVVDSGRTVWRTKVIVGKPRHQTAFFSDTMETVVFNPYWGVPQSIIVNEMLPKLQNDPGYLDRQGYEVISSSGRKISSYNVDWWQYYDKVPVGVRQPPGRRNALGEVKFLFPNKHAIYLHDTPTKKLFSRRERAFSHGCVRVENPRQLAKAVLGWDEGRIASTIATRKNTKVPLKRKFKVHLTYFTAWPGAGGKVSYSRDVYSRDGRLAKALEATRAARN